MRWAGLILGAASAAGRIIPALIVGGAALLAAAGCQDTIVKYIGPENKPDLYIATDSTRYQAHDLDNVTDVEAWTWTHTGQIATVYHHSFVHHGQARITIEDANGAVVYDHVPVEYDLVNDTKPGVAGDWRVTIEFFGAKGRVDFSVAKKRY